MIFALYAFIKLNFRHNFCLKLNKNLCVADKLDVNKIEIKKVELY